MIRLLAAIVALSFLTTLLPIIGSASAEQAPMACCVGKEANHCHSSVKAKQAAAHDHTAEPSNPVFKSAVRNPCSDCCACLTASRQQKREPGTTQIARHDSPYKLSSHYFSGSALFSAGENWAQISPRGPPTFFQQIV